MRILIDVDGVVADLMGGMRRYVWDRYKRDFDVSKISRFHMPKSPEVAELHADINLDRVLDDYLSLPDVYQMYVDPIDNAVDTIKMISLSHTVGFVTATLKNAPQSYASKFLWLRSLFGDIPMIACPSHEKFWIAGDVGIDDRYDTCSRWTDVGVRSMLFKQPWNEAPSGYQSYDWKQIGAELG